MTSGLNAQLRGNAEGLAVEMMDLTDEEIRFLANLCQNSEFNMASLMKIVGKYVRAGFKIGLKKAQVIINNASQQ